MKMKTPSQSFFTWRSCLPTHVLFDERVYQYFPRTIVWSLLVQSKNGYHGVCIQLLKGTIRCITTTTGHKPVELPYVIYACFFQHNFCEINKSLYKKTEQLQPFHTTKTLFNFSLLCFLSLSSRRALISAVFFCLSAFKLEDEYRLSGNRSHCSLVGIALEFANSVFAVPSVEGELWVEIIDDSSPMKSLAWKQRK